VIFIRTRVATWVASWLRYHRAAGVALWASSLVPALLYILLLAARQRWASRHLRSQWLLTAAQTADIVEPATPAQQLAAPPCKDGQLNAAPKSAAASSTSALRLVLRKSDRIHAGALLCAGRLVDRTTGRTAAHVAVRVLPASSWHAEWASLRHENVVRVLALAAAHDFVYVATERCAASLDELASCGQLSRWSLAHRLALCEELVAGVGAIHRAKLVHGGISTSSVFLGSPSPSPSGSPPPPTSSGIPPPSQGRGGRCQLKLCELVGRGSLERRAEDDVYDLVRVAIFILSGGVEGPERWWPPKLAAVLPPRLVALLLRAMSTSPLLRPTAAQLQGAFVQQLRPRQPQQTADSRRAADSTRLGHKQSSATEDGDYLQKRDGEGQECEADLDLRKRLGGAGAPKDEALCARGQEREAAAAAAAAATAAARPSEGGGITSPTLYQVEGAVHGRDRSQLGAVHTVLPTPRSLPCITRRAQLPEATLTPGSSPLAAHPWQLTPGGSSVPRPGLGRGVTPCPTTAAVAASVIVNPMVLRRHQQALAPTGTPARAAQAVAESAARCDDLADDLATALGDHGGSAPREPSEPTAQPRVRRLLGAALPSRLDRQQAPLSTPERDEASRQRTRCAAGRA
jgi:hypothetical protein